MTKNILLERLEQGPLICAEGFVFELEKRGYVSSGQFVPEVVIEHPEALESLHREFQRAGSNVVEAFTYNANEEKLRVRGGKQAKFEDINRNALRIARKVADTNPSGVADLVAGNISNTNTYDENNPETIERIRSTFDKMVNMAVEEGADFIIGETFYYTGEALIALEVIKKYNMPSVIMLSLPADNKMKDGDNIVDAMVKLEQAGADVVGMNCFRGPETMLPYLKQARKVLKCHMAALPLPFRTSDNEPTYFELTEHPDCTCQSPHGMAYPTALDTKYISRYELAHFAKQAYDLGINFLGVCCGNNAMLTRQVAEALGFNTQASRYGENLDKELQFLKKND